MCAGLPVMLIQVTAWFPRSRSLCVCWFAGYVDTSHCMVSKAVLQLTLLTGGKKPGPQQNRDGGLAKDGLR